MHDKYRPLHKRASSSHVSTFADKPFTIYRHVPASLRTYNRYGEDSPQGYPSTVPK
jgi:hypothetical protein